MKNTDTNRSGMKLKGVDEENNNRQTGKFGAGDMVSEKQIELSFDNNNPYAKQNNFFASYMGKRKKSVKESHVEGANPQIEIQRGYTIVNNILQDFEELNPEEMYKSIAFTEKSMTNDPLRKQNTTKDVEHEKFMDLIGKSKMLINELHVLEQEHIERDNNEDDQESNADKIKNGLDDLEAYQMRKETLLTNIDEITKMKLEGDPQIQEEMMKTVKVVLDKEEQVFSQARSYNRSNNRRMTRKEGEDLDVQQEKEII